MGSKIFRVHPLYNITGSETLQRELMSVVYVFIHDVVIMAGHTSDKCTAGLSVYPLFHQCFMALRKLRKIVPILLRRIFGHHCIRQIRSDTFSVSDTSELRFSKEIIFQIVILKRNYSQETFLIQALFLSGIS